MANLTSLLFVALVGSAICTFEHLKNTTTNTPRPTPECVGNDVCRKFGGWKNVTTRHPHDPNSFIVCTGTPYFYCQQCPGGDGYMLYYSEKCYECMWEEDDELNVCPTTAPTKPVPTAGTKDKNFCNEKKPGNYEDPDNKSYFYSCVHGITYQQWCGSDSLYYNKTCDACLSLTLVGGNHVTFH